MISNFETIHKIFAGPMVIIPKVRNTIREKKKKCTKVSLKQFGANGVGLHVKRRLDVLSVNKNKPPIVNTQCVVYLFQCDLCNANYNVGYTARHLHHRISEHRYSAIGKHLDTQHGNNRTKTDHCFKVLRKCNNKFDCLVYEMLYMKDIKPSLNMQADSICAKLFT